MRYKPNHAAKSGSVPFALRGPKSAKKILSAAVAGAIGLVPAVLVSNTPALAAVGDFTITATTTGSDSVTEGSAVTLTVTKNNAAVTSGTYTVKLIDDVTANAHKATLTSGGSGLTAQDVSTPSPASIVVGTTTLPATVTIPTSVDSLYEWDETFAVQIQDSSNLAASNTEIVTIKNDDTAPTYSLAASPTSVSDGAASAAKTTISATLGGGAISGRDTKVTLTSVDGTAIAGQDYTPIPANTSVVVTAGQTASTTNLDVNITKDNTSDLADPETFTVNGVADNAASANQSVSVQITDGDAAPVITLLGNNSVNEGSAIQYTVSLDHQSEKAITVGWNAVGSGGSQATPGTDFTYPATRTVTIPAKTSTATFSVPTTKDSLDDDNETFTISLANPTNATLGATTSLVGTITQGADAPTLTIEPATVTEGDSGRTAKTFTAKLSAASTQTVRVNWTTADLTTALGNAVAGKDYVQSSGVLSFAPGTTSQSFSVDIIGDKIDEGSGATPVAADGEKFNIGLTRLTGDVTISLGGVDPSLRTITITDDDATPTLSFADKSGKEGNEAAAWLMPVTLSNPSDHPISVTIADLGTGTANSGPVPFVGGPGGEDYTLLNTTVSIMPEASSAYPVVLVNGDKVYEKNETIKLTATPGTGSQFLTSSTALNATVTLENDDKVPNLEINSASGKEGDTVTVTGTVTGQSQEYGSAVISFAGGSSKGSKAASADDFVNPGVVPVDWNVWTVDGGIVPLTTIKLNTDTMSEPAETIIVTGAGVENRATVTEGIITIEANGTTTPPAGAPTLKSAASFRLGAGSLKLTGTAAAAAKVSLWGKPVGADEKTEWEKLGDTTASASGAYEFMPEFTTTGWWFKTNDGTTDSNTIKVNLKEDPDLTVRSSSKGSVMVMVAGDPKIRGLAVRVLRAPAGTDNWVTVGTGIINKDGSYSRTWTNQKSGSKWVFRAYVYGDADTGVLTNYKDSSTVTVR